MIRFLCSFFIGTLVTLVALAKPVLEESLIVIDPAKDFLSTIASRPELVIDHVNMDGYEVYGPKGTKKWLDQLGAISRWEHDILRSNIRDYPSPEEIDLKLLQIAHKYPNLTKLESIGTSVKKRPLMVLKISDHPETDEIEPEFKYIANMHGDEIVGRELMMRLIEDLLENYESDPKIQALIDNTEIFIMPSMNPDGAAVSRRWNGHGADLNRDFPDFTTTDNQNSAEDREPETQAVMDFQARRHFALSTNFHGGAVVMNYAWDTMPEVHPLQDFLLSLATDYANTAPYMKESSEFPGGITNGYAWYEVNGGMQDWSYYWHNDLQFTVELSDIKWAPYSELDYYYAQNRESMLSFMEAIHQGAGFVIRDAHSNQNGRVDIFLISKDGSRSLVESRNYYGSEFYVVLPPGPYQFEVKGDSDWKRNLEVNIIRDPHMENGNFLYLD
ncbi:MAG: hypothetical protein COV44_11870 [Deltaproteobacteria bacterium CG11_big_fil_rev_8_21_14_0_20_45_16]|nr:MAG: hypothetical protein COV44_11870 [Deltaproteobacteria bacterium CG11_big_fil_rev_8_21_14_0_20_45_16]